MTTASILAKLIAFPVLGGQSNRSILDWIRTYLDEHGVDYRLVEDPREDKASLHCRFGPPVDGGTILSGHTDVVPTEGQSWRTDPFVLTDGGNGKYYGRGSCDMKGFLACCLAAVPDLRAAKLKRPIYFAFSYDEEVGCRAGVALAEDIRSHYAERPARAIIGEPTLMQPMVGQKGINVYKTTVTGSQGHSSRVREEVSAIHEAARLIVWLEDYMDELITKVHHDDRFQPNHTTLHVGVIHGGSAFNIVANECWFDWEFRNIPTDRAEDIFTDFSEYCRRRVAKGRSRYPEFDITHQPHHPPVVALDTPEDAEVVELVKRLSGQAQTGTVAYAAEAGQFSAAGFEAVICGPGSIAQAHRADEFVSQEQLAACDAFLRKLIADHEE